MKEIEKIIAQPYPNIEDLIQCLELIRSKGHVALVKLDGERSENQYTVAISFPSNSNKEIIRADKDTLKEALLEVLNKYIIGGIN